MESQLTGHWHFNGQIEVASKTITNKQKTTINKNCRLDKDVGSQILLISIQFNLVCMIFRIANTG